MEKVVKIFDYEKENLSEINETNISIEDLKKCGISDEILAYECALRKFYGDDILRKTEIDEIESTDGRTITKVDLNEMQIDNQFKAICEEIESSEFDQNLDIIVK